MKKPRRGAFYKSSELRSIALNVSDEATHHNNNTITAKHRPWYKDEDGRSQFFELDGFEKLLHEEFAANNMKIKFNNSRQRKNKWQMLVYEVNFEVIDE